MKTIKFYAFLIFFLLSLQGLSQQKTAKDSLCIVPKVDLLNTVIGLSQGTSICVAMEAEIKNNISLQITFLHFDNSISTNVSYNGFYQTYVRPEADYFINAQKNQKGIYLGAFIDYYYSESVGGGFGYNGYIYVVAPAGNNEVVSAMSLGFLAGCKLIVPKSRFCLDAYLGLGPGKVLTDNINTGPSDPDYKNIILLDFVFGLRLGYRI